VTTQTSHLLVNHAGLDTTAGELKRASEQLQALLDGLNRDLDARRDQWSGGAQTAYLAARAQWDAALRDMRELLFAIGQAVETANHAYRDADARGRALFGG
jgi:early secretory antigenic target protein ESAT-6